MPVNKKTWGHIFGHVASSFGKVYKRSAFLTQYTKRNLVLFSSVFMVIHHFESASAGLITTRIKNHCDHFETHLKGPHNSDRVK